jgi:hypothetical protein
MLREPEQQDEVLARRTEALRQARLLRKHQELRGAPLFTSVSDDLDAAREDRDSRLADHSCRKPAGSSARTVSSEMSIPPIEDA